MLSPLSVNSTGKKWIDLSQKDTIFAPLDMNEVIVRTTRRAASALTLIIALALATSPPGTAIPFGPILDGTAGQLGVESTDWQGQMPVSCLPGGAQDDVATGGKSRSPRPASLVLPPVLKPNNTDSHLDRQAVFRSGTNTLPVCPCPRLVILTSTSLVSSNLGCRATLVGARPSGTS